MYSFLTLDDPFEFSTTKLTSALVGRATEVEYKEYKTIEKQTSFTQQELLAAIFSLQLLCGYVFAFPVWSEKNNEMTKLVHTYIETK